MRGLAVGRKQMIQVAAGALSLQAWRYRLGILIPFFIPTRLTGLPALMVNTPMLLIVVIRRLQIVAVVKRFH